MKHVLLYDVSWMDRVFSSKATTAALLSQERDLGNISSSDFEASLKFFPSQQRWYPILGFLAGATIISLSRRIRTTKSKFFLASTSTALVGHQLGTFVMILAHRNYLLSIENPHGFKKALENIQTQLGQPLPSRHVLVREYSTADPTESVDHENALQIDEVTPQPKLSKWDQIRTANKHSSINSSWDTLRQKYEREIIGKESNDKDDVFDNNDIAQ